MVQHRACPEIGEVGLRELYQRDRLSLEEIALLTGLSAKTVWRRLCEYHVLIRCRGSRNRVADGYTRPSDVLTPAAPKQWVVVEGISAAEIARRSGFDKGTVTRHLRAAGFATDRPAVAPYRFDRGELVEMIAEGWSQERIARMYGCHQSTVSRALNRDGPGLASTSLRYGLPERGGTATSGRRRRSRRKRTRNPEGTTCSCRSHSEAVSAGCRHPGGKADRWKIVAASSCRQS